MRPSRPRRRRHRTCTVELLEPRTLLSTWTVNSLGDTGGGVGTSGDLRYCITQADATTGNNTINFSVTGTITLNSALPDLSNTTGLTDIEGPGAASLTVARSGAAGTPDFGIFTVDTNVQVSMIGLALTGGLAIDHNGGGIYSFGSMTITNCTIDHNSDDGDGGGIYNGSSMTIANSTIANNSAGVGGGLANDELMTITDSTIANNSAAAVNGFGGAAGGIENDRPMTLTNCNIAHNSASVDGGAVESLGSMFITNCNIANDSARGAGGRANAGLMAITNSTIADNSAHAGGGIQSFGLMTITNCTIANNSAGADGGGIDNEPGGPLTITNCTITSNSAFSRGGGIFNNGAATLNNTIVALNTRGTGSEAVADDIGSVGTPVGVSSAYNLIGTGGAGGLTNGVNHNQVGIAIPGLDPNGLQDNGGPTQTIAVLPGSPAIGKGSSSISDVTVPTTDQREVARPSNSVDIGAFQDRGFTMTIATGVSPQSAAINTAFANPLAVFVTSPFGDPVQGGTINFGVTPASGGASAKLSAGTATIGAGGLARVTAAANGTTGSYTATASASGVATPAVFSLTNLSQAVSVTGVSVSWGTETEALQTAADGIRLLPAGRNADLPWLGIDKVSIDLSQAATLAPGDFTVTGITIANYGPVTSCGSGTSYTITFAQPISKADRVTITIGSGTIATFTRRLDVLPGDFNDDGKVNSADLVGVRNEFLGFNGAAPTIFGDINGNGTVNITDYNLVKKFLFTTLPPLP
jgi:hypothetical protein